MRFKDRIEAGRLLARKLAKYKNKNVIVYALPRGGVITALEIAKYLHVPLDLIIARKISHPRNPEYAIAATAENGHILGESRELMSVDENWLKEEVENQRREAARRKRKYLHGRKILSPKGKVVILVDDGVATGLTIRVGIAELKHRNPSKLIVAVPVVPKSAAKVLEKEADEFVALDVPNDDVFLGAVGSYYDSFPQVEDKDVIKILDQHEAWLKKEEDYARFDTLKP